MTTDIRELLEKRILVLDGAMGTMIQRHHFVEADYRGTRFLSHSHDLKNNNEALMLSRPDVIEAIHLQYLQAGADIIERVRSTKCRDGQYPMSAWFTTTLPRLHLHTNATSPPLPANPYI